MAGIGFELKKLFKNKGIIQNAKAYSYSTIITIGPSAICIMLVLGMQYILGLYGVGLSQRLVVTSAIVYAYILSQIVTSGFTMIVTRFVSDKIYNKEFEQILPSMYGTIIICLPIVSILSFLFYMNSPLDFVFKLFAYCFNIEMTMVWIFMTYVSALKNYVKIIKAYIIGAIMGILALFLFLHFQILTPIVAALVSVNIVFLVVLFVLTMSIVSYLQIKKNKGKCFLFLQYFDEYASLFFINFFYTVGLYIHNIIYWMGDKSIEIEDTYYMAPFYDSPSFFAFLSMLPIMIFFVVRAETSFYERYRRYYKLIIKNGRFSEIEVAKKNMVDTLWDEIRNMMELQILVAIAFFLAMFMFFSRLGISEESKGIFEILLLGCFATSIMYVVVLLLLYFDDRKGALWIVSTFLVGGVVATLVCVYYELDGFGFFIASITALVLGLIRINHYLNNINYYTFSARPVIYKHKVGLFERLVNKIYKYEAKDN